jgi:NADH-quinone oxidoreductase subunit H
MTATFIGWGLTHDWAWFLATILGILVIALPLMLSVAMVIYAERKIWAAMALRRGPNVVGPFGLLQSFADGLKVFLKETIIPSSSNKGLFLIAPIISFTGRADRWAVVPFDVGVVLSDINVGLLYILAASSLGVYGIIIAGWASNSKYPFFSRCARRADGQLRSVDRLRADLRRALRRHLQLTRSCSASRGTVFGISTATGSIPCCSRWRWCS